MGYRIQDAISCLEHLAPPAYQESYDNSGLIVGDPNQEVSKALISLDCTEEVVDDAIAKGCNLIIFPEGTRTTPGEKIRFQRGAAHLALRTKAKVTALWVDCSPVTLIKNEMWYQAPKEKPTLSVHYLKEIDTQAYRDEEKLSIAARHLTRDLQNFYEKVLEDDRQSENRDQAVDYRVAGS